VKPWLRSPSIPVDPPRDDGPPIMVQLGRVMIDGQTTSRVNTATPFTATVSYPITGTISVPITYTWQATGQSPVIDTKDSVNNTAVFAWPTAGTQVITVTAENAEGAVTVSHTIQVNGGNQIYLPLVLRDSGQTSKRKEILECGLGIMD